MLDLNGKNNCKIFSGVVHVKFICTLLSCGLSFLPPVSAVVLSSVSGMMNIFFIFLEHKMSAVVYYEYVRW